MDINLAPQWRLHTFLVLPPLLISANPSCSNVEIKQWLTGTARELSLTNLVGAGLVDAYAALTAHIELTAPHCRHTDSTK